MIKEMLENYMNYKADIKTIEYQIKKIELEEISISGSNFQVNGDIRPQGYMTSSTENKILKNADRVNLLEKQKNELQAKIEMIDSLINTLSDYHREIANLKYKYNKTNSQIATIMKREERTIRKALNKIISILEEKYKNSEKVPQSFHFST